MVAVASAARTQAAAPNLPSHRDPYYAGKWQKPKVDRYIDTISPGTGESLGKVVDGSVADAEAAIAAAKAAFREWRRVLPLERAKMLRAIASLRITTFGESVLSCSVNSRPALRGNPTDWK